MTKFFWILFLIGNTCYSQTIINGNITDTNNNVISKSSVLILKKASDEVISYTISDNKGFYTISFTSSLNEIDIQVKCMGYETITKTIKNISQNSNFKLKEKTFELKEVLVKSSDIVKNKDTIRYLVSGFSKEQDRSIGDVLKRIPGIDVLSDGKIMYQGKPINKYYIEGLDLLEGKYNLANENLPYKEVTQVQILENHQPIRALDSLKFSEHAAINLKLKNKYTYTGQARLGSGLTPLLWDVNLTPMLFSPKKQILTTYQANNTGENVATQIKNLTLQDLKNQVENNFEKKDWLNIQQLSTPDFSEKRWLDNNIHLISGNYLQKMKNDYEMRVNFSYLNDYHQQNGFTNTEFITPVNTISILEQKRNYFFYNSLQTNVTLQKNTNKNYLKNSLEFQGFWDSQKGNVLLNKQEIKQHLNNEFFRISNSFNKIILLGKQMIKLNSNSGINKTPQTLNVKPGQFEKQLNNNFLYDEIIQQINLNTFYSNNSVSLIKAIKNISLEPSIGFHVENQQLNSEILISRIKLSGEEYSNNLDWFRTKFFANLQTQYKKNKLRIELSTPINHHIYKLKDNPLNTSEQINRITFEPKLNINYEINSFWNFNSSINYSNRFGTINQLHYAYILQNYRNLQRINVPLSQIFNQDYTLYIQYRNPVKSLFWHILYLNSNGHNNLLYQTNILPNGTTELQAIKQDNNNYNHNISTKVSKYLYDLKTNLSLNANFGYRDYQQFLNKTLSNIKNQNLILGNKLETDIFKWLSIEYQANWAFSKNKIQNKQNPTITQQNHILNLNFLPKTNQYFALKSEYIKNDIYTDKTENIFTDLIYRYTFTKNKIDLEFQLFNLFNTINFRTINISEFSYVETNFKLRPRQILFKIRFTL
jgi:hypothetical protein